MTYVYWYSERCTSRIEKIASHQDLRSTDGVSDWPLAFYVVHVCMYVHSICLLFLAHHYLLSLIFLLADKDFRNGLALDLLSI